MRSLTGKVLDLALKGVCGRFARFIGEHAVEESGRRTAGGYISVDAKHITVHKKLPTKW